MSSPTTPRDQLDRVFDLVRRALRYTWLVVVIAVVGGGLSVLFALSRPHQYESETVLLYREMISQSVLQGRQIVQSSNALSARYKEMLLARSNLIQVVQEQKLFPDIVKDDGLVAAADEMRTRLTFRDRGAGTFQIAYRGDTPAQAQKVTERLAELLKQADNKIRREQAEVTKNFLLSEKQESDAKLKENEHQLATFLYEHPEFAEDTQGGGNQAGAGIRAAQQQKKAAASSSDARLSALERQRRRLQARLADPNAPVKAPSPAPRTSADIRAAQREVDEAQRDLSDKLARFTEKHPDVMAARARLAAAEQRLKRAEAGLPATPEEVAAAPVDRAALQKELSKVEAEIAAYRAHKPGSKSSNKVADDVVDLETSWAKLNRQVDEARERSSTLEARAFTAEITASSEFAESAQLSVIDDAYLPSHPAGKSRKVLALAGTMLFGGMGVALALGLALIDDRIYRRADLDRLGIAPTLIVIPGERQKRRRRKGRRG